MLWTRKSQFWYTSYSSGRMRRIRNRKDGELEYRTVKEQGSGEVVEKKSRFIAEAFHAESEEEALACIERERKKYYDARHTCFAYVIGTSGSCVRAGDDGEPSGTAGRPILDCIAHAGLYDTCITVTRYFGGTLLGTGGLVKAYTQAAEAAIANAGIAVMKEADRLSVRAEYTDTGKLQYYFGQNGIKVADSVYDEAVTFEILTETERTEAVMKKITELTSGKAVMSITETGFIEFE